MAIAYCFRCKTGFESFNDDDLAGDGKCEKCKELSKRIAFDVDMKIAEERKHNPVPQSLIRQMFTEEEILKGDKAGALKRINAKELGLKNWGS